MGVLRAAAVIATGLLGLLGVAGCSADEPASGPTAPPPALIVGGEYTTEVMLTENSCPGITVEPNPTLVVHRPGGTEVTLVHAGQAYPGRVEPSGTFVLPPVSLDAGGGVVHTLAINGAFSKTGFRATVTANVTTNGASPCRYVVSWVGTKDGPPNTIP